MPKNHDPMAEACLLATLRLQAKEHWTAAGVWQTRFKIARMWAIVAASVGAIEMAFIIYLLVKS